MTTLTFSDTHNLVAFLAKPAESEGFEQIVDFLNAHTIKYALTINPNIYTACIEQFWATVKAKTVNGEITLMGYEKVSQKLTFYKAFFSQQWKFLIHTILQCLIFLDNQLEGMAPHDEIYIAPSHTKKIFANMRRSGKGFSGRETSLFPTMMVQAQAEMGEDEAVTTASGLDAEQDRGNNSKTQSKATPNEPSSLGTSSGGGPRRQETEDASKQGRKINDIDKDAEITLVDETQGRYRDEDMFGVNDLYGDEVVVESEAVAVTNDARTIPVSVATITNVELTLAQTLAELKSTRPKAKGLVIHEEEQATTPTVSSQQPSQATIQDKGKVKMVEPEHVKKLSKKDQIRLDEELAFKLQAEEEEE
ncbi:hypothetical protein Tco_1309523 [Tanacetum coccineum]